MAYMEEAAPERRTEWGPILLLILAVGGSAVGVMIYQHLQGRAAPGGDNAGFDISQTTDQPRPTMTTAGPGGAAAAPGTAAPGSLGMIKVGNMSSGREPVSPIQAAALAFADICRANENRVRAMTERYTRAHPIFEAYGKEWMGDPQLKKLNDDYMVRHDPVEFLHGLAQSKHFGEMVRKYAVNPAFMQYIQEAMKSAPPEGRQIAMDYIDKDSVANSVIDNVLQSVGLPAGVLGANAARPGEAPKFDASKMLNSVMGSNPALQKQMSGKDSPVNDPEFQKRLKGLNH